MRGGGYNSREVNDGERTVHIHSSKVKFMLSQPVLKLANESDEPPSTSLDALDYDEQWIGWSCTTNADSETSLTRSRSLMPLKMYVLYLSNIYIVVID